MRRHIFTLLTVSVAFLGLWGCASTGDPTAGETKAAKEFATQKMGVCCFQGMKSLDEPSPLKTDPEKEALALRLAAEQAEREALARQLAAEQAEREALARQHAAEQAERETLARQLASAKEAKTAEERRAAKLLQALREKGAVVLHDIHFASGKSIIRPESAEELAAVAKVLRDDPALTLEIQGHTDSVGSNASNLTLSQQRAAAVKGYLLKRFGIASDRLTATGFGEENPIADNATDEGKALNRRVEIHKH